MQGTISDSPVEFIASLQAKLVEQERIEMTMLIFNQNKHELNTIVREMLSDKTKALVSDVE